MTSQRPAFIPSIVYKDNRSALKWLESAFGFEPSEVLTDNQGNIVHAEMSHDGGVVMIGTEWADRSARQFPAEHATGACACSAGN